MKHKMVAITLVLLIGTAFLSGCSLTPSRHIGWHYGFFVRPLKGEEIKNFTVYLPFPRHKGKVFQEGWRDLLKENEKRKTWQEPAEYSLIDTKHGPMLKVFVPKLKKGIGAGFEMSVREPMLFTEYYLWQESGDHLGPFLYGPRFDVKNVGKGKHDVAHTMIYSKSEGEEHGFTLEMRYDMNDRAPSPFPIIIGDEWGGDFICMFGVEDVPEPFPSSAGMPIEVKEAGWKEMPVAEFN